MKISCRQPELSLALNRATAVAGKEPRKRKEYAVTLQTESDSLEITVACQSTRATAKVPALVEREGTVVVKGRTLTRLVNQLPDERVDLETETPPDPNMSTVLHLACSGSNARISTEDLAGHPTETPTPHHTDGKAHLRATDMTKAIRAIAGACSEETDRPSLAGILLQVKEGSADLVACDGKQLIVYRSPTLGSPEDAIRATVPGPVMRGLANAWQPDEVVSIKNAGSSITLTTPTLTVTCEEPPGTYPSFERLIPEDAPNAATVDGTSLRNAITAVGAFARAGASIARIAIPAQSAADPEGEKPPPVRIWTQSDELGSNEEALTTLKTKGTGAQAALNVDFLTDVAAIIGDSDVTILIHDSTNPIMFRSAGHPGYTHIVMPSFVQW